MFGRRENILALLLEFNKFSILYKYLLYKYLFFWLSVSEIIIHEYVGLGCCLILIFYEISTLSSTYAFMVKTRISVRFPRISIIFVELYS